MSRPRQPQRLDAHLKAVIDQTRGLYDNRGWYGTLVYRGFTSWYAANVYKNELYRSARSYRAPNGRRISLSAKPMRDKDGTWMVQFTVIDHAYAKAWLEAHPESKVYDRKAGIHQRATPPPDA